MDSSIVLLWWYGICDLMSLQLLFWVYPWRNGRETSQWSFLGKASWHISLICPLNEENQKKSWLSWEQKHCSMHCCIGIECWHWRHKSLCRQQLQPESGLAQTARVEALLLVTVEGEKLSSILKTVPWSCLCAVDSQSEFSWNVQTYNKLITLSPLQT